jgi:hypothetical protein
MTKRTLFGNRMTIAGRTLGVAAIVGALFALGRAQAHHSYAAFDQCKTVVLEGEVNNVEWVNPHILIDLRTADDAHYRIEWFALEQLRQAGMAAEPLKPGDRVVITGNAIRDPSLRVLSRLSAIQRPSDGWSWLRAQPRLTPTDCAAG